MDLKVLSWNIWIDGFLEKWEEFLQAAHADIIGLQEVKDDDPERDIIKALTDLGYEHSFARTEQVWEGKTYRHGPAIFTKFPILHSEKIQLDKGDDERAAAYAQIDVEGTLLHVFSTHLIHTCQQPSEEQVKQTKKLIAKLPSNQVIVMGDFNATPESVSIQAMKKVLTDTDPSLSPTWSVYPEGCGKCHPQGVDIKLDYIFVSRDLAANSFEVGQSQGSDHLPIRVNVEI
jgi:endonuclease/exonuclease/phosphatase family metal-dependent hydrolase